MSSCCCGVVSTENNNGIGHTNSHNRCDDVVVEVNCVVPLAVGGIPKPLAQVNHVHSVDKFAMATWHHSDASALLRTRKPKSWTRRLLRAWSGCVLPLTTLSTLLACQERPEPLTQQHDAQLGVRGALHVQHADVWPSRPCCCRHPAQAWRTQPPNRRRRTPPLSRSIVMKP